MEKELISLHSDFLNPKKLVKKAPRDGAGIGIIELAQERKDIVVISSDVAFSTRANFFAKEFPERFIQVGVAEQNAIGVAAGLAYQGLIPYYFAYAIFGVGRNWEPIRTILAYPKNKVRIIASHAGIITGPDGATHQMTEDLAIMRVLPNFIVISPCDFEETRKAIKAVVDLDSPVYIRLAREKTPLFTTQKTPFEIGKIITLKEGKDLTIIGTGSVVYEALLAAFDLEKQGISAKVLNCHTVKPIDKEKIRESAKKTKRLVSVEDHQIIGGLGGAIAEIISEENLKVPLLRIGIKDRFGESGRPEELYKAFGLDKEGIKKTILSWLEISID